jgi:hypothetical protein
MRLRMIPTALFAIIVCTGSVAAYESQGEASTSRPPLDGNEILLQIAGGTGITLATVAGGWLVAENTADDLGSGMAMMLIANGVGMMVMTSVICKIGDDEEIYGSPIATFTGGVAGAVLAILAMIEATDEVGTGITYLPLPAVLGTLGYQLTRRYRNENSSAAITINDGSIAFNPAVVPRQRYTLSQDAAWTVDLVRAKF